MKDRHWKTIDGFYQRELRKTGIVPWIQRPVPGVQPSAYNKPGNFQPAPSHFNVNGITNLMAVEDTLSDIDLFFRRAGAPWREFQVNCL
ncbi:MAG: hypothetical protein ABFD97_03220 [Syntrophobacter sp.]